MQSTLGFTDSDLAGFAHETDRRGTARPTVDVERQNSKRLLRSAPNPRDMALTSLARTWAERLPEPLRPAALCARYPRVANRLALCWEDPVLVAKVFADLLEDRRGTRKGWPPEVQRELIALRQAAGR